MIRSLRLSFLAGAVVVGACSSPSASPAPAPAPETTSPPSAAPAPAAPAPAFTPDPAVVRASRNARLTGTELGTMWTFENPPLEYWRETYDFDASPEWLEHVRLASVRYGEICSASFVSPEGLVMTNHHCARDCVEAVSTSASDYVVDGFYAAARDQELLCPDLYLDQLVEITDVTERIEAAAPAGAAETEVAAAIAAESEEVEQECGESAEQHCQVVSLFHGGQYKLYRYRRFQPVKLVFAPELQAGFFGGDPDNFTYPRYALDVSFVRAYADETTPARTPEYFRWDTDGAHEGELVFVTGNPGSTSRQMTVAQLIFEERLGLPLTIQRLEGEAEALQEYAALGVQQEREVRDRIFSLENALKNYRGQLGGLRDTLLMARKYRFQEEFRERIAARPELREEYGDVWERIAGVQERKLELQPQVLINNPSYFADAQTELAATLVLAAEGNVQPEVR